MDIVFKVFSSNQKNYTCDVHLMHLDRFYIGSINDDKISNNPIFRCEIDYCYKIKTLKSIFRYMRYLVRENSSINYFLDFIYCEKIGAYRVYKYWEKIQIGIVQGSTFWQGYPQLLSISDMKQIIDFMNKISQENSISWKRVGF